MDIQQQQKTHNSNVQQEKKHGDNNSNSNEETEQEQPQERTTLSEIKRSGGRGNDVIRPVSVTRGVLTHSHGSVQYKQGETTVIASVMGPLAVKRSEEIIDKAVIQVTFQRLTGPPTDRDTHMQFQVKHALAATVLTSQYPQTRISFVIQVVHDDGGLLACSLNAALLALLDSGIACHSFPSAISLVVGNKGNVRVDPDHAEEAVCDTSVCLCFTDMLSDPKILLCHTEGETSDHEFDATLGIGIRAAAALQQYIKTIWQE